jgi:type II secretory pathway pseudopilin PulG
MSSVRPSMRRSSRPGVALIDLTVSVLLMGILAAAVLPRFSDAVQRNRVTSAAQRLCADIRLARNSALASSASKSVVVLVSQSRYTLVGVNSLDRPGTDYAVQLAGGLYETTILSANLGGDASLTFDMHGRPDSGGTMVLRAGGVQKTVSIDAATGEASVL